MDSKRTRTGMLVGLAAAAGAFGAAAMMSAATAPAARADDFTDIVNVIDKDLVNGQADIAYGLSDFGSNPVDALSSVFLGADYDFVVAPENLFTGTVDALTNQTISTDIDPAGPIPANFAEGLADAQSYLSLVQGSFSSAGTDFAAGEYADAAVADAEGFNFLTVLPLQELLLGVAASL